MYVARNGPVIMQTQAVTLPTGRESTALPLFYRIWRHAMIAFGLGLSGAWACLLGYGLIRLVGLAL